MRWLLGSLVLVLSGCAVTQTVGSPAAPSISYSTAVAATPSPSVASGPDATGSSSPASASPAGGATATVVTVKAVGTSGVFGTATFANAAGGQTQVVVKVEPNSNPDMPTVVTAGTCAKPDETKTYYVLPSDTRDGAGTSVIPVALADLIKTPHEIHLLMAPDDMTVAACGEIK